MGINMNRRIEAEVRDFEGQVWLAMEAVGFKPGDRVVVMAKEDAERPVPLNHSESYEAGAADATASIVALIRGTEERIKQQRREGAGEIHYMHTIGMLAAASDLANAIERGDHAKEAKP